MYNLYIMGKNTSISLGEHFERFIQDEITTGRYNSVSEVVRSALRLLENEENKVKELRRAIEDGEQSGFVDDFRPNITLEELHKKIK